MNTPDLSVQSSTALMSVYQPLPVSFSHGQGSWLYDSSGKAYLDALCGIAVTGLGHNHARVTQAVTEQAQQLLHTSNIYRIAAQEQLATDLLEVAGMDQVFFCNSGAEANEAAIKLARLHAHHNREIDNPAIAVMSGAFHGRTLATLSATDKRSAQAGFEPLVSGFVRVPFGNLQALEQFALQNPDIAAVMLEPVQGESGIQVPPPGYLKELQTLCSRMNWLLILDEVQSGNGRCGAWYACQLEQIRPDIMTTAKGLGNGVPIGACMAVKKVGDLFRPGSHASTFGGNPLACAAAGAVLDTIRQQQLCERAAKLGAQIQTELRSRLKGLEQLVEIRTRGLMIGIEMRTPCTELVEKALAAGLLINVAANSTVRMLPPLNMSDSEINQMLDILCPLISGAS